MHSLSIIEAITKILEYIVEQTTQRMANILREKIKSVMAKEDVIQKINAAYINTLTDTNPSDNGPKVYINPKILGNADQITISEDELSKLECLSQNGGSLDNHTTHKTKKKHPKKYVGGQRVIISGDNGQTDAVSNQVSKQKSENIDDIQYIIKDDIKKLFVPFYQYALNKPQEGLDSMKKKLQELREKILDIKGKFIQYATIVLECSLKKVMVRLLAGYFKTSLEKHVYFDKTFTNKVEEQINTYVDTNKTAIYNTILCTDKKEDQGKKGVSTLKKIHKEYTQKQKEKEQKEKETTQQEEKTQDQTNSSSVFPMYP